LKSFTTKFAFDSFQIGGNSAKNLANPRMAQFFQDFSTCFAASEALRGGKTIKKAPHFQNEQLFPRFFHLISSL